MRNLGAVAWTVLASLALTAASIVWVGVGIVRHSSAPTGREDFGYQRMLTAVDELLHLRGDLEVLQVVVVDTLLHGRQIEFDTLVITADPSLVPSLGTGGFLHDEVRRYNAFQRDRAGLALVDYDQFEQLRPFNPSIFRPYRRGDGTLGVTRTAAAWNRRVQSPFDDEWDGEVQATDATRGWGLMSPYASVSFESPRPLSRPFKGRRQVCEFETEDGDAYAYCLSEARRPQAVFRSAAGGGRSPSVLAGWNPLRLDGERLSSGDSAGLAPGSVLRIAPLEPVVFGEYWDGVLSSRQWVNGRMRRRGTLRPPLDLVAAIGRRPVDPANPPDGRADLLLSLDVQRTRELTDDLSGFIRELPIDVEFAAVVLVRVSDGAIVALAEAGARSEPGRSRLLERVAPGSAVKPLLAAAVLSERPELADMEIPARSGRITRVLNAPPVPSRQGFTSTLNCRDRAAPRVDLRDFLRCSNNEYAASLLLAGLQPAGGGRLARTLDRSTLLRSAVSDGIANLYGLTTDPVIADSLRRTSSIWDGLRFTDGTPVRIPFEALPDESRPALLSSGADDGTDLGLLYRYAYGAWENRWNLFDLTNGFARVATDRRVQIGFGVTPDSADAPPPPLGLGSHDWYAEFLRGLSDVARDGTARGLASSWDRLGLPGTVYAKTGTLAEAEARAGRGLFMKSLVFAVGESAGSAGPIECGIVGTVYLSFAEGPPSGSLPSYQLDFARTQLGRFLRRNWQRFEACPDTPSGTG